MSDPSLVGTYDDPAQQILTGAPLDVVVFPFLCRLSGIVTFLKFPDGRYLDADHVASPDPATRSFVKVFEQKRRVIFSDNIDDTEMAMRVTTKRSQQRTYSQRAVMIPHRRS
eukprot:GILK01013509.1.p1 GENE.GILK01013509.1~~GILK01013509.1.p1  ORF type:complete len:112 (+),score=8.99 GILK01013509.1:622-957(+)